MKCFRSLQQCVFRNVESGYKDCGRQSNTHLSASCWSKAVRSVHYTAQNPEQRASKRNCDQAKPKCYHLKALSRRCTPFHGRKQVSLTVQVHSVASEPVDQLSDIEKCDGQAVTIFYKTGWSHAMLHFAVGIGDDAWTQKKLADISVDDSEWKVVTVLLQESASQLRFVLTDGLTSWDNPNGDPNACYVIDRAGVYVLESGEISILSSTAPFLVVSDLDGTMVGDDDGTAAFKSYWNTIPRLQHSKLVYSSGRSWEQYQELRQKKANLLAEPDAYIGAVGTKVYLWDQHLREWKEDAEWKRRLNEGWNLEKVREAAYGAIQVGGTEMVHFRPPEELNEHKITLGVNDEVLADVLKEIHTRLDESQVSAKVIFSGTGGWKYVDIVSSGAGKLESLEYIREHFNFEREQTVACGDSGNDILMMEGGNRAIIVGNAQPDLVKWVTSQPEYKVVQDEHKTCARLHVATRGHAFGILEGIGLLGLDLCFETEPGKAYLSGLFHPKDFK